MIYLIITTVLTASFFLFFKYFEIFKVNTFQALVVNYITAAFIGFIFAGSSIPTHIFDVDNSWMFYAFALGFLFISVFFLMAKTAQSVSVTVSSVASKMSMIIPSLISIFMVQEVRDNFDVWNVIILLASLASIVLVTYKEEGKSSGNKLKSFLLVFVVFIGSGLVDSVLNLKAIHFPDSYFNSNFESGVFSADQFNKEFAIFCFLFAFILGVTRVLLKGERIELKSLVAGVLLGIPNYFSIYYLQQTLSFYSGNGSFVFPVINIGIILISSFMAFVLFREKLSLMNVVGVLVAVGVLLALLYH